MTHHSAPVECSPTLFQSSFRKSAIWLLVFLLLSFLFLSCAGGGTAGTGGRIRRFDGNLAVKQENASTPAQGVQVRLIQTGQTNFTDAEGDFSFVVGETFPTADFEFRGSGINNTASVTGIPNESRRVDVDFQFDAQKNEVDVDDVDFEDDLGGGDFCDEFPEDPTCSGGFCDFFPNDPFCTDEFLFDDYCLDFPNDPICLEGDDDFCVEFPEDPLCDDALDDDLFCLEFPDDPTCSEDFGDDPFCVEFPEDPLCDESFTDDPFCLEFPDDPTCTEDFSEDPFCLEFPEDPLCDESFEDDSFCLEFPDDPTCF